MGRGLTSSNSFRYSLHDDNMFKLWAPSTLRRPNNQCLIDLSILDSTILRLTLVMSSDDDFDHAAYTEYEDQLYQEESLSGSEDDLDSEIEEALYSQVHYASSLLVSGKSAPGEMKTQKRTNLTDDDGLDVKRGQMCLMDNSVVEISSGDDDDDDDDDSDGNADDDSVCSSSHDYPEVINVCSDQKSPAFGQRTPEMPLEQNTEGPGEITENWNLNEKDLGNSTITKQRPRYYTPGKGLPHVRCYNCNEKGHLSQYCPEPKKLSVCFLCGGAGHVKRNCPNELCFNCHEPGHISKQCRKPRVRPFDRCKRCHVLGHFANDCPDRWRQYHLTTQAGPVVCPDRPASPPRSVYCYNCGRQGHYGHECSEETWLRRGELPLPFVVQYDGCHMLASRGKKNNNRQNSAPPPSNERKHQRESEGFDEQDTQEDYERVQRPQATRQDYDRVRGLFQAPPNKIQKLNHGDDIRRVSFVNVSHQTGELNTAPYADGTRSKRKKKKKNKRREEESPVRTERIVEVLDPSYPDEGLIEEPYQTKRKKPKKRKQWQDEGRFSGTLHNDDFFGRKKFKQRSDRRITNPHHKKNARSFEDRDFDGRTSSEPKKDRRNFVSNRGFRGSNLNFNNQMHGKKSNPQFFKRYTF